MYCNCQRFKQRSTNGTLISTNYHAACICSLISVSLGIYKCRGTKSIPLLVKGQHKLTLLFEFHIIRTSVSLLSLQCTPGQKPESLAYLWAVAYYCLFLIPTTTVLLPSSVQDFSCLVSFLMRSS